MRVKVVGIDASLSLTCVVAGSVAEHDSRSFASQSTGKTVRARAERIGAYVNSIAAYVTSVSPSLVVIEGYSYGSQVGREYLGELGGVLRCRLVEITPNVFEVPPSTLKKFATGSGKADKAAVASALTKRYGEVFGSSDEADAYACYQIALIIAGQGKAATTAQRESVGKVQNGVKVYDPREKTTDGVHHKRKSG